MSLVPNGKNERLKIWIGLITIMVSQLVSFGTAYLAYTKPNTEDTAKAAYTELSQAVAKISKENIELHKDVSNIRGYLDGQAAAAKAAYKEKEEKPEKPVRYAWRPEPPKEESVPPPPPPPQMKAEPKQYIPPPIQTLENK